MNNVTAAEQPNCQKNPSTIKLDSCFYKFESAVNNHAKIIMAVAIVVVIIMVSISFTKCLTRTVYLFRPQNRNLRIK
jgi:hypothetical protein